MLGVFANALNLSLGRNRVSSGKIPQERPGLAAWLLVRLRRREVKQRRLAMVERISLAPRQTIALVEADGQRVLVASSADGAAAFYPLKPAAPRAASKRSGPAGEKGEGL